LSRPAARGTFSGTPHPLPATPPLRPVQTALPPLRKRWILPTGELDPVAAALHGELSLPAPLCALLARRGMSDATAARAYLRPDPAQLHAAAQLAGIGAAVERLAGAIRGGETVLVHGDFDVDGICATALYTRVLTALGGKPVPFIPRRVEDGYDLTEAGVAAARSAGATLILTGDCGIRAHAAISAAAVAGIDVVVTDHHTPADTLPPAAAVVNPSRADCAYPNKGLCGAGVAFRVCEALAAEMGYPAERLRAYLDLVAIATVADLVPLQGENRTLVRWGLRTLRTTPNPGLRALLAATRLEAGEITAGQVGFVLAPRLNAVGRMGEALRGARLLLTDDPVEAAEIAAELEEENRSRRREDTRVLREAMELLERDFDPESARGVVLAGEGWHPGVVGIVASRVVERIHRPAVLVALAGGEGRGSGRSVPGFDLLGAFQACSPHFTRFGGHRAAAGCTLEAGRVEAFAADFDAHARAHLLPEQLEPELRVDLLLRCEEANAELARLLRHTAPHGMGNAAPVFALRGARLSGQPRVLGEAHLRFSVAGEDGGRLDAIAFGMAERHAELLAAGRDLDVAFRLEEDEWKGRTRVQARVLDFRAAG
jgi:single-stranded-DNA-specific exonuclease